MPSLNWLGILLLICSALGLSSSFVVLEDNVSGQVALANDNSPGPLFRSTYVIGNPRDGYECINCNEEVKVDKNGKVTLNAKMADKKELEAVDKEEKPLDYTDSLDEVADPVSKKEKDKVAVGPLSLEFFGEAEVSQALAVSESYHFFDQTVAPPTSDWSEESGDCSELEVLLAKEDALMEAKYQLASSLDSLRTRIDQTLAVARDQLALRLFLGTLKANMSEAQVRATSRHWLELKNTIVNKDFQWLLDRAFDLVITSARQSAVHQFLVTRSQQQQQQLEPWTSLAFWVQYLVSLIVAGAIGALSADRRRLQVYYRRMMMTEAQETSTSSSVAASKAAVASLPPVYTPAAAGADNKAFVA